MLINEKVKSQFFEMLNNSMIHDITINKDYRLDNTNTIDVDISATMTPNSYNYSMIHDITINKDSAIMTPNYGIKKVIFNDPATIVYWTDGTKTVVKCCENDAFNKETGLAMAFMKKKLGNDNTFHKVFKKWVPKEEVDLKTPSIYFDGKAFGESLAKILKGLK